MTLPAPTAKSFVSAIRRAIWRSILPKSKSLIRLVLTCCLPPFTPSTGRQPSFRAGDRVTFQVRSFRAGTTPTETWDFGDGTGKVAVRSDGNVTPLAKDGYAITEHRFVESGDYLVSVETTNASGFKAVGRLHVHVEPADE